MFKYRKDHPLRTLDWRWQRARMLNEYGKQTPGKHLDDKWIRVAAQFRSLKDKCSTELELYRLYDRYVEIAMAYELWDEDGTTNYGKVNPMRYEIEARLLANESCKDIGKKAQLAAGIIDWYEHLFFNVNDRLENKMYIFHVAIGDAIQKGMTDRDYAVLWKMYAYVRGSAMLDYLITTFSDWSKPSETQVQDSLAEDYRNTMRRKAAMASRMVGVNSYSSDKLIELHTKIIEIEKAAGDPTKTDSIQNNIQVMLSHLPLLVGGEQQSNVTSDARSEELLNMSLNNEPLKQLANFTFPKPGKDV